MKSSKRKSLRRQWSFDVPSSIQKKFREVANRSKSLDEQKLLLNEDDESVASSSVSNSSSLENFGKDVDCESSMQASCHSSWLSSSEERLVSVLRGERNLGNIHIEVDEVDVEVDRDSLLCQLPRDATVVKCVNLPGLLSTIDEMPAPRSPTKRTSPYGYNDDVDFEGQDKMNVPRKFARNEFSNDYIDNVNSVTVTEDSAVASDNMKPRRDAICEEMERYIIVDHKGHSLRKYRENLIRHRVLKELCLL